MHDLVVAMTGASGSIYAVRLLEVLLAAGHTVHLTISKSAVLVLERELGIHVDLKNFEVGQLLPDDSELAADSALQARNCRCTWSEASASPRSALHPLRSRYGDWKTGPVRAVMRTTETP